MTHRDRSEYKTDSSAMAVCKSVTIPGMTGHVRRNTHLHHAMENNSDMAIMQAIITVGHSLGLSVVVEGVETSEQDNLVKTLSCDLAQGYLYARPMPADSMPAYLVSMGQ
ncbi:EAL domain-containing protein [Marinobacter sp. KM021]|uniref:EAL domain-containing protein n=1 Tax=Marinobacter sp. KM021 TaxID=3075616 RepID=UPI003D6ACC80